MTIPFKSKDEVKNNFYKGANRSVAYVIRKGLIKPYRESVEEIIKKEGYEVVEMTQFKQGANYAIFKNPGKENPAVYKIEEITID